MRNIAVIPARSGSKGVKDKNIIDLNGKPLLAYSVEAAVQSRIFQKIHVSTDSKEYAKIAVKYGAEVPFIRSKELSADDVSTWDAMRFVIEEYAKMGEYFDTLTVLQPTSPLRTEKDIIRAFDFFNKKNANMISSVCETEHSPLWSNTLPDDLSMVDFEDEKYAYLPRQKLPIYYRENGAIYIVKVKQMFSDINLYKDKCYAFIMDRESSVDIDTEFDYIFAKMVLDLRLKRECHDF